MTPAVAVVAEHALQRFTNSPVYSQPSLENDHTALLLSGGGNLAFFHLGVIKTLHASGLLPRVLSGASAGSVIAAIVGTRAEYELDGLHEDELSFIGFPQDEEPGRDYSAAALEEALAQVLPDVTFAEAEEISGKALNISLAGRDFGGVVCGPKTTPNVLVRDAVRASCAVPFVYEPVVVRERRRGQDRPFHSGRGWVDGSLYADVPEPFIRSRYGVRHTIVSLVNPAVRPFIADPSWVPGQRHVRGLFMGAFRDAALNWARIGRMASVMPKARDVFDTACRLMQQTYGGDLVLTPSRRIVLSELLDQPSSELVRRLSADGELRTRARLDEVRALARRSAKRPVPQRAYGMA